VDIAAWLHSLGMQQYQEAFRDNAIDAAVLPELTADDLKDLGVSLVGHRRKLLAAIAALRSDVDAAPEPASLAPTAERRQLTVMFGDLVGSTALAARLDPEDLREVIGAYHRAVADVVRSFDGFVAKYMGDGVLVYFGYPRAHEDDAERAVRAGLGVIDAVGGLDVRSVKLQARIGIATGLVVVGDLIGEGSAQEQSVVGETPNLAARLQALAEPGAVVIAAGTRRLVGDLFEYRDLGAIEVKGIAAPVPAWQVLHQSIVASRFEALRGAALSPLVGRDEEIDLLLRRWARAPITRTARCPRSSTSSAGHRGSRATTHPLSSWTSSKPCWPAQHHRTKMWHSSPICCHCRLRSATLCRTSARSARRKGHWRP
jgi:class 3 adenylate cyclase